MRWPHENAITRRDEHLARTRRISAWIAGGATFASIGLAAALGYALPGHSFAAGSHSPAGQTGTVPSTGGGQGGSGNGGSGNGGSGNSGSTGGLNPPQQPPAGSAAPPVVSSGGS